MNKRRLVLIIAVPLVILLVFMVWKSSSPPNNAIASSPTDSTEQIVEVATASPDEVPVTRAMVAKMLALAYSDQSTIDTMERTISFTDTDSGKWYDKYINAAVQLNLMSGTDNGFLPEGNLTLSQVQTLLDKLDEGNTIRIQLTDDNRELPVSLALWTELYEKLLTNIAGEEGIGSKFGISRQQIIVMITPKNNELLSEGNIISDIGAYTNIGLNLDEYIDKAVTALTKDGEIICVTDIADETPTIIGAFISSTSDSTITIFSGGAERTYSYEASDIAVNQVCDIKINGTTAESVSLYGETITGTIKSATSEGIELEEYGVLPCSSDIKIYSIADGTVHWRYMKSLLSGTDMAEFVMADGEVCAAVIIKSVMPDNIRVVLGTTGFTGYLHDSVEITSDYAYTIKAGDEIKSYNAGDVVKFSPEENSDLYGQKRIYITPAEGGTITINSIGRNWGDNISPKYRGTIEISKEDGGFYIINEVSMNEYLYAVIPSEMPTSYGLEAAKVQAVISRSYAYNQFYGNRFYSYGAHVDDSVSCQVYNNTKETDISIQAAEETTGQCLAYNGEIINAYFFSTSCGVTSNSGEVWGNSERNEFPTTTPVYFTSVNPYDGDYSDLSDENSMRAFLTDASIESLESDFAWFRWNVTMTAQELTNSINASIAARYAVNPNMIKTLNAYGNFVSTEPVDIGLVKGLEVVSRSTSGLITELKVIGENATILIKTEYNIRTLLKPVQLDGSGTPINVYRQDGSYVSDFSMMPSAYFVFDQNVDAAGNLASVTFYGGGSGHGVGMSQNGVKAMLDAGYSMEDIFSYYFTGTKVIAYK